VTGRAVTKTRGVTERVGSLPLLLVVSALRTRMRCASLALLASLSRARNTLVPSLQLVDNLQRSVRRNLNMPSLTAVELVEDSEPEREAARTQAQEERRKRRVMSKSPSSQVVFMLSSSPVPVPLPRLVEPLADAALADPLAASGVHSPVARSQALEPVGRRSSSPIVIESNGMHSRFLHLRARPEA
jgi:hypothetical protein